MRAKAVIQRDDRGRRASRELGRASSISFDERIQIDDEGDRSTSRINYEHRSKSQSERRIDRAVHDREAVAKALQQQRGINPPPQAPLRFGSYNDYQKNK